VPRTEQYAAFGEIFPTVPRAAALFNQKYPPDEVPDVYIDDTGVPSFPDYPFQGPSLLRRTHYLPTPTSPAEVIGPFLTQNSPLAERLAASGDVLVDQLGAEVWLLLPRDRTRAIFWTTRTPTTGKMLLHVQVSVPPGRYREPQYSFTLQTPFGDEPLGPFQASPVLEVPYDEAVRGAIQVDVRDGSGAAPADRIQIERSKFVGI
jgi:hypothetical protein